MLHRKPHIENHLQSDEKRLSARVESLTRNGTDAKRIEKDNQVKQLRAQIRKAKRQLATIVASEILMADKAEIRIRKEAAAKSAPIEKKLKKKDADTSPAKKKKKRRVDPDEVEQAA